MQPMTDHFAYLCKRMSAATGIHVGQFGIMSDNPSSAEAIYAENEPLILKCKSFIREAKAALSRTATAALTTELGVTYAEAEEACEVSAHFLNPAMPTLAQQTDSSIKLASAVEGFAGTRRSASHSRSAAAKAGNSYGVRFARVPQGGDTRTFCAMLASRGFVYWSRETAGEFDHFHRNCRCLVVPDDGSGEVEGYDPDEWLQRWRDYKEIDERDDLTRSQKTARKVLVGMPHASDAYSSVGAASASQFTRSSNVILTDKQFGKKAMEHCADWGLDPSSAEDREVLKDIIAGIIDGADSIDVGNWRGQPNPCTYYLRGEDLVIVNADDCFVTIMKGGGSNKRYRNSIASFGSQD